MADYITKQEILDSLNIPNGDNKVYTKNEIIDRLCILLSKLDMDKNHVGCNTIWLALKYIVDL